MTTLLTTPTEITIGDTGWSPDEAQLAAAAFVARVRARTLGAYCYDLRSFFQWADDHGLDVLAATRAHLEWYRTAMEQRGYAAATIDRRLCAVCGYYRFAHLHGRINSNPAQYVRRPEVQPSEGRGMDYLNLLYLLLGLPLGTLHFTALITGFELLDAFRAGDGVDLISDAVQLVLQELIEVEAFSPGWC